MKLSDSDIEYLALSSTDIEMMIKTKDVDILAVGNIANILISIAYRYSQQHGIDICEDNLKILDKAIPILSKISLADESAK